MEYAVLILVHIGVSQMLKSYVIKPWQVVLSILLEKCEKNLVGPYK
jgi:hypothetical protein